MWSFKTDVAQGKIHYTIIDDFSKYLVLTAIDRQDENTIAKVITNKWVLKFGAPKEIQVDCGKNFESNLIKELAAKHNIKMIYSSPYHHSANGLIER